MSLKRFHAVGGILVFTLALAVSVGSARADVDIYQATANDANNGMYFGPDGTPNPPTTAGYWEMGNTITFAGAATSEVLDTAFLTLYGGGDVNSPISMSIYAGNNPNTGALLGTSTAPAGFGVNTTAFNFNGLVVPDTVTFIVGLPDQNGSYDSIFFYPALTSHSASTVGSGVNSLWYGTAPGNFVANDTYAIADGAGSNLLQVQFNGTDQEAASGNNDASVAPEPAFYGFLALGLTGLFAAVRRHKNA